MATTALPVRARPGLVLAAICACTVLVVGFVASINLAAPMLAAGTLHPSAAELLWIVDTYVVFFACLVIPCGAVGDRFGRKGVLLTGLGIFAVGALISALAPGVAVMLVGRAVTGVGAACVLPNTLAVLVHATPPERRSAAIATWASMTGAGGVLGNVGGGAVLSTGSWRWLFAAVVPISLGCAAWVATSAPRTARHERALQPLSAALLTLASLALLVGIIQGPENGWASVPVIGGFVLAGLLFAAWVFSELRAEHPLLDPRLFRIPRLRAACLGLLVTFFGMFALFYVNASFLQYSKGYGVLQAGLGILPMSFSMLFGSRYAARLSHRIGAIVTLALAFVLIGAGLLGLSTCDQHTSYPRYALWLVVVGAGATLALPRLSADIADSLPREQAGVGAGLQSTTREFGSALGVAVIGTILTSRFAAAADGKQTVVQALAAGLDRANVLAAYTSSISTGLRVMGVITLVAGAAVIAQAAARRRR